MLSCIDCRHGNPIEAYAEAYVYTSEKSKRICDARKKYEYYYSVWSAECMDVLNAVPIHTAAQRTGMDILIAALCCMVSPHSYLSLNILRCL